MNVRYPIKVALTSLALVAVLPASAAPPHGSDCEGLRQLYSPQVLRRARAALLLEDAREHAQRATLVAAAVRGEVPVSRLTQPRKPLPNPHESTDPRLKHLLALLATKCWWHRS